MKKLMALLLTAGILGNLSVGYALDTDNIEDPVDTGSATRLEQVVTQVPITITEGKAIFDGDAFSIDQEANIDFPGSFTINPMMGKLRGTEVPFTNTGETEITLVGGICKATDSSSPKVVNPRTFSDWAELTIDETTSNIALGFMVKDQYGNELVSYWFDDEQDQTMDEIYTVAPGESITIEVIGKHGMSWPNNCKLYYDCPIGFDVEPLDTFKEVIEFIEVPVEQPVVEEPEAVEEPTVQEPVVEEPVPVVEETVVEETIQEPVIEEPTVQEPVVDQEPSFTELSNQE